MIAQVRQDHPNLSVRRLCELLGLSRSWYYDRPCAPTQAERDMRLRDAIERLVLAFPGYGYRRVAKALQREGWDVNHKRVLRVMRRESLLCQLQRRFVPTTDSRHALRTYPNLLAGLPIARLDQVWVADSPPSACRPPSFSWPASSMRGRAAASAGTYRARSTLG